MELRDLGPVGRTALEQVLGYLNYSSGAEDPQFLGNLNQLYRLIEGSKKRSPDAATWLQLGGIAAEAAGQAGRSESRPFRIHNRPSACWTCCWTTFCPAYLEFHRELLFHQTDATLFRPFFVGRVAEAILQHGGPWDEPQQITEQVIRRLNDFVGYRPVAVLESRELEPYPHERVRPIPLYIQGAGVAVGAYEAVILQALEMLRQADPAILRAAYFEPDHLQELALDPRAV